MNLAPVKEVVTTINRTGTRRRRNRRRRNNIVPRNSFGSQWLASLNDPFTHTPPRIGLGCMLPTTIESAYSRNSATINADGTFQLWFTPGHAILGATSAAGAFIAVNDAASGVAATFTQVFNPDNQSAFAASMDQARVLSAGIRIYSLSALTTTPGVFASCVYPPDATAGLRNGTNYNPLTNAFAFSCPQMDITRSNDPLQVTWRPSSLADVNNFTSLNITSTNNEMQPAILIAGKGLPASSTIFWEAVAHYECYNVSKGIVGGSEPTQAEETGGYETMSGLWNSFKSALLPVTSSTIEVATASSQNLASQALAYGTKAALRMAINRYSGRSRGAFQELKFND